MWYLTFTCSKSLSDPSSSLWQCWYWGNSDAWLDLMTFPACFAQLDVLMLALIEAWNSLVVSALVLTDFCNLAVSAILSLEAEAILFDNFGFDFSWTVQTCIHVFRIRHTSWIKILEAKNVLLPVYFEAKKLWRYQLLNWIAFEHFLNWILNQKLWRYQLCVNWLLMQNLVSLNQKLWRY